MSPRKASGAPITDVTAVSAFAAEGSPYSFAGEFTYVLGKNYLELAWDHFHGRKGVNAAPRNEKETFTGGKQRVTTATVGNEPK